LFVCFPKSHDENKLTLPRQETEEEDQGAREKQVQGFALFGHNLVILSDF
jgi:hypothetical protein